MLSWRCSPGDAGAPIDCKRRWQAASEREIESPDRRTGSDNAAHDFSLPTPQPCMEEPPAMNARDRSTPFASRFRLVLVLVLALALVQLLLGCAAPGAAQSPDDPLSQVPLTPGLATPTPPSPSAAAKPPAVALSATGAGASAAPTALPGSGSGSDTAASAATDPSSPSPPRARLDPEQDAQRIDLWQRLRDGFRLQDLNGDLVRKWEQYYASQHEYVQRITQRGGRYLFHITEEVEKRGMPTELALLPFIESAFNPQAMSSARASGMWQFMPATGKDFDLRQNLFRDDRRNVLASTRAALDYLQRLHKIFGDWHLALAAYNWGQGNVMRAVQRNQRSGRDAEYALLEMPAETRNYVPKLQAVKNIVLDPERFGLKLPALENHPYFLTVGIERDIDVSLAAQLAGLPLEEFRQLNPQMNKPVILAAGTTQVLLPYDNANRFLRELPGFNGPLASWTAWTAPRTLRVEEAARLIGVSEAQLREVNRIPPRMLLKVGSTLLVPRSPHMHHDVSGHVADNASLLLAPEGRATRKVAFKAGKQGESVAAVARRYKLSAAAVAQWNNTTAGGRFRPGQQVVLMLPAATAPVGRKTAAPAARSGKAAAAAKKPPNQPVRSRAPAARTGPKSSVKTVTPPTR